MQSLVGFDPTHPATYGTLAVTLVVASGSVVRSLPSETVLAIATFDTAPLSGSARPLLGDVH